MLRRVLPALGLLLLALAAWWWVASWDSVDDLLLASPPETWEALRAHQRVPLPRARAHRRHRGGVRVADVLRRPALRVRQRRNRARDRRQDREGRLEAPRGHDRQGVAGLRRRQIF